MALSDGMRPTYIAFHAWLRANHKKIAAQRNRTVVYSGQNRMSGDKLVGVYKLIPKYADKIYTELGVRPKWETIETVLKGIYCKIGEYYDEELPRQALVYANMWDFACKCGDHRLVTKHENQQIWRNLSACYAKNAIGDVYIIEGDQLKKYPDLFLAELAVLQKNGKLSSDSLEKVERYVPNIRQRWEAYRKDTPKGRRAGR